MIKINFLKLNLAVLLILLAGCGTYNINKDYIPRGPRKRDCRYIKETICESRPATIFIHGTLYPFIDILVHAFDSPIGLVPAKVQGNKFLHGKIGYILNEADPCQFNLDSFYLFGWSGKFSFEGRANAAWLLYESLKKFTGPITIIAHSHGANVALHLAEIAHLCGDINFKIDKLILMACPVQAVTEDLVGSPVFKKVISLYSTGDIDQVKDPQAFYHASREFSRFTGKKIPLFSGRYFPQYPNVIQRRVLLGRRNLTHLEFIFRPFISRLPYVIKLIEDSVRKGYINDCDHEYIINVPRSCGMPELLVKQRGCKKLSKVC